MDTLRVKLFLAIAGGTATLSLIAYLVFSWSFDRGFVDYVNRADEARLQPFIETLAQGHAREGGWKWVAEDRRRWFELIRETVGLPPVTIDPRLMLFDADGTQLVGRPENFARAVMKPIEWQAQPVGYLGYVPRPEALESIERLYLRRQHYAFAAIGLGMLAAALLLGAGLSGWLSRRIRNLAGATESLIQGNYDVRLRPEGHDELARLARDFNTLAETLAAARQARRKWIADIAHELRTPLSIVRGEIEALQDGVRPLDREAVNSLAGEAARLARLIDDLHTLSLSDLGALSYHKEPVDLAEIVHDVVEAQRGALQEKGLAIRLDLQRLVVSGDADRLAQVFSNLLQNSLRYTDAPGEVRIGSSGNLLVWEDSAPGVPQEDLPRLTEHLFRVEGSRSRASGGSGLGLAIAHAIVQAHGGTLTTGASTLGGLRIELRFPAWPNAS
ncbi:MAG TPA: ATP-binding protein [Burkholderiales bacterium]|nr:ATP-binding protein [Burkholderiales bacterium]